MSIEKLSKYQLQKLKKFIKNEMEEVFFSRSTGMIYLGLKHFMGETNYRWAGVYRLTNEDISKLPPELDKKIASMVKIVM